MRRPLGILPRDHRSLSAGPRIQPPNCNVPSASHCERLHGYNVTLDVDLKAEEASHEHKPTYRFALRRLRGRDKHEQHDGHN